MLQTIDWDDPTRGGYYRRNREFLAEAMPLESCLTEDPIQVMYTGTVAAMREAETALRRVQFAEEFALAATVYEDRDFSMIDVIRAGVTKGTTLAEWTAARHILPQGNPRHRRQPQRLGDAILCWCPRGDGKWRA